jgi:hypothetical protein
MLMLAGTSGSSQRTVAMVTDEQRKRRAVTTPRA